MTDKQDFQRKMQELTKQQSEALQRAVYFPMTVEESGAFDERADLIAKLRRELMQSGESKWGRFWGSG